MLAPPDLMVPWAKVGQRWSEFDNGTIGDGVFPDLATFTALHLHDTSSDEDLGLVEPEMTVAADVSNVKAGMGHHQAGAGFMVFRGTARQTNPLALDPGDNALGQAAASKIAPNIWVWAGFEHFTVTRGEPTTTTTSSTTAATTPAGSGLEAQLGGRIQIESKNGQPWHASWYEMFTVYDDENGVPTLAHDSWEQVTEFSWDGVNFHAVVTWTDSDGVVNVKTVDGVANADRSSMTGTFSWQQGAVISTGTFTGDAG
jgi:hypothetical protein